MCCQATDDEETIRQITKHGFGDQLRWSRLEYTPHERVSGQKLTNSALVDALRLAHEIGEIRCEFTEREWRRLGMEVDVIHRGFFVSFTDSKDAHVYYGPDPGINEYKNYPVISRKRVAPFTEFRDASGHVKSITGADFVPDPNHYHEGRVPPRWTPDLKFLEALEPPRIIRCECSVWDPSPDTLHGTPPTDDVAGASTLCGALTAACCASTKRQAPSANTWSSGASHSTARCSPSLTLTLTLTLTLSLSSLTPSPTRKPPCNLPHRCSPSA
jgi:hypothetical protein